LPIVEHPRLVHGVVGFVAVPIFDLAAMPRVGEKQDVSLGQPASRIGQCSGHRIRRRVLGEDRFCGAEPLFDRERIHVLRVGFAGQELAVPSLIVIGIDGIQTDVYRQSLGHEVLLLLISQ
jgi:hypothetical protein